MKILLSHCVVVATLASLVEVPRRVPTKTNDIVHTQQSTHHAGSEKFAFRVGIILRTTLPAFHAIDKYS